MVISLIKTGTFKHNTGWIEYPPDHSTAFRTNAQWFISHLLPLLKAVATRFTQILICWHMVLTPKLSNKFDTHRDAMLSFYHVSIASGDARHYTFSTYGVLLLCMIATLYLL